MRPVLRKSLFQIHLWAGLTLGLLLAVVGLTGAGLAWRKQLEPRLRPALFNVQPGGARLSPDELVRRAQAAHPTGQVESIRYFGDSAAAFEVYFSNADYVHLNPYTGEVLGFRKRYGESFGWLEGVHKFLQLDPRLGEPLMGSMAMIFGGIIVTGLALWWPATRRALRAGLTLNWKLSGRPWYLNLHKALGSYVALIVLVSVLTGTPIAFDWLKNALYPLTASRQVAPPRLGPPAKAFAGFAAMAAPLDQRMPRAIESYIAVPKNGVVSSYAVGADAPHRNARSYLWLNPADAAVLRFAPYAAAGRGFRLYYWMFSLHTGAIGGWFGQLVLCLGALGVPVLGYTGAASFLKRKFAQSSRRRAAASARPAPVEAQTGL